VSKQTDPRVAVDELILANTVSIDALITVLETKGVLSREEVIRQVDEIKKKLDDSASMN
jgi:hypothetical protein